MGKCIWYWTTMEPTKRPKWSAGLPGTRAIGCTSRPPAPPGSIKWRDGLPRSPEAHSERIVRGSAEPGKSNWGVPGAQQWEPEAVCVEGGRGSDPGKGAEAL